jgi:hypothetical protein
MLGSDLSYIVKAFSGLSMNLGSYRACDMFTFESHTEPYKQWF